MYKILCPLDEKYISLTSNNECPRNCMYSDNGCCHPNNSGLDNNEILALKLANDDLINLYKERIKLAIIFNKYVEFIRDSNLSLTDFEYKLPILLKWLEPIIYFLKINDNELSLLSNTFIFNNFTKRYALKVNLNQFFDLNEHNVIII